MWNIFDVDAGSLIADAHDDLIGSHTAANFDLAFGGVFQRIGDKIGKNLLQPVFITEDDGGNFAGSLPRVCAWAIATQNARSLLTQGWAVKRPLDSS